MSERIQCPYCKKFLVKGFLSRHIQAFHKSNTDNVFSSF
ncbi:hypothetical protein NPIRD3C_1749 [Nitrosopumilus piranensis]|uniref:C2H2-type domain-containing protein n=1 Tax=Nitrosopumilus piranensis TaxID=1582439 RepID=A0A0C5BXC2_9ARCH|nr:hypothetical protein NPIRD3C_1749 [Nitrosopumilus piranensis]